MKKQRSGFALFATTFFVSLGVMLLVMGLILSVTVQTDEESSQPSSDLSTQNYHPSAEDGFRILIIAEDGEEKHFALLTMDPAAVEVSLVSLPGELTATVDKREGTLLSHEQYAGGGETVRAAEALLGIKVDRWLRIRRQGAVNMIDALGGMEWEFSEPLETDRLSIPVGRHLLDGETVVTLMEEDDRRLPETVKMAASLVGQRLTEQLLNKGDWFFQVLTANTDGNISQFDYQSNKKLLRWYLTHANRKLTGHTVTGERQGGKLLLTDEEKALLG